MGQCSKAVIALSGLHEAAPTPADQKRYVLQRGQNFVTTLGTTALVFALYATLKPPSFFR